MKNEINWKKIFIEMTPTQVLIEYYNECKHRRLKSIKVNEISLTLKEIRKTINERNETK